MWQAWLASVSVLSIIWRQFFSSGCLSVPPPPTAPAALWRRTGSTWRSPWTTSTRRQRPQPAAVPAVLCIHAVATTGYVQQPSICDAGNIMMLHTAIIKKCSPLVAPRCSSTTPAWASSILEDLLPLLPQCTRGDLLEKSSLLSEFWHPSWNWLRKRRLRVNSGISVCKK